MAHGATPSSCGIRPVTLHEGGRPWSAFELYTATMVVVMVPELGGKIIQITSRDTGRAWLWRNPHLPYRLGAPGESYVQEHDTGGWDDLLPTVAPCNGHAVGWPALTLTDHGEIWCQRAQVFSQAIDPERSAALTLRVGAGAEHLPLSLERTYRVSGNQLAVDYVLSNPTDQALPFIWAAHPAFNLEGGAQIMVPESAATRVAAVVGGAPVECGDSFAWPGPNSTCNFSTVPDRIAAGWAVKLFARADQVGLRHADGATLMITATTPWQNWIGLWLNYCAWSGAATAPYYNAILEPTTSPCDGLDEAVARNEHVVIAAQSSQEWTVIVQLENEHSH